MTEVEEWRPVVGFEGVYEVSNFGQVRSLDRAVVRSDGLILNLKGRIKKPTVMKSGHRRVGLQFELDRKTNLLVHRLVAESFIGPQPEDKPFVLHWDDNPASNYVGNLRWGNRSENSRDSVRNGRWRSFNSEKTQCMRQHDFTEENTYLDVTNGKRQCKTCRLMHEKKRQERRRNGN